MSSLNSRSGWSYSNSNQDCHSQSRLVSTSGVIGSRSRGRKGTGTITRPEVFVHVEQHKLRDLRPQGIVTPWFVMEDMNKGQDTGDESSLKKREEESQVWDDGTFSETSSLITLDLTRLMHSNDQPLPAEANAIRGMISQHKERVSTTNSRITILSAFRQDMANLISKADEMITTLNNGFAEGEYGLIRCLGLQLARSAQFPLSFSISHSDFSSYDKLPSPLELLLLSVSIRLRKLHLCLTAEVFSAIPLLKLSLPSLEVLSILCTNGFSISEYSDLDLVCKAPKLQDLTLIDVEDPANTFSFPWAQITHCRISFAYVMVESPATGPDTAKLLTVLGLMVNLTSCDLVCEGACSEEELETELVACTELQHFTLTSWPCYTTVPQLFSRLLLPSLSVFKAKCSVKSIAPSFEVSFRSIRYAINASRSPLTTLEFEHGLIAEEDLSVFRTTPTLEFLKLVDVDPNAITNQTLDELTARPNEDNLLPRLIDFHLSTEISFISQKFVTMVSGVPEGTVPCNDEMRWSSPDGSRMSHSELPA
ncbi:hypothetical protein F5146DRAFT_1144047 [Armillaria mellea]|nr:hypothetical protein F5146DRAFT_1144047 [Armillaria mellea]